MTSAVSYYWYGTKCGDDIKLKIKNLFNIVGQSEKWTIAVILLRIVAQTGKSAKANKMF